MEGIGYWTVEDTKSPYFHTWEGQLEYFLMSVLLGEMRKHNHKFPMCWYGALNEMELYMIHPSYSPFVDHPRLGRHKKRITSLELQESAQGSKASFG